MVLVLRGVSRSAMVSSKKIFYYVIQERVSLYAVFTCNGLGSASWAARMVSVKDGLSLSSSDLGWIIMCAGAGALLSLPWLSFFIKKLDTRGVVRSGVVLGGLGLAGLAWSAVGGDIIIAVVSLLAVGSGFGLWDGAMNVQASRYGAHVEGSTMSSFHAAYSIGAILGAIVASFTMRVGMDIIMHFSIIIIICLSISITSTFRFSRDDIALGDSDGYPADPLATPVRKSNVILLAALGVMTATAAVGEGVGNDWLTLAFKEGRDWAGWISALGYGVFLTGMLLGRLCGDSLINRWGRVGVLRRTFLIAAVGVLLFSFTPVAWAAVIGAALWGFGISVGFPAGMSAAGERGAGAVSVVSSLAYVAFFMTPPIVGILASKIGILSSFSLVIILMLLGLALAPSAR